MSKSVCILATGCIHPHTRSFIDAVSQSSDMQDIRFVVLVNIGTDELLNDTNVPHLEVVEINSSPKTALEQQNQQWMFDCIVANTQSEHELAINFKKAQDNRPVYVIRNRLEAEPVLRSLPLRIYDSFTHHLVYPLHASKN